MKADFEKGTKVCSKCKRELPISEFCKDKSRVDGLQNYCKGCNKKYYEDNKENIIAYQKLYYEDNKKDILVKRKQYSKTEKGKQILRQAKKKYSKSEKGKEANKKCKNKTLNTFGRNGNKRGQSGMIMRDYELTDEQLKRRENKRMEHGCKSKNKNPHGILIWYNGMLDGVSSEEYSRVQNNEYKLQKACAIRGYIGRKEPSVYFLFDFDLEQMLNDNVYVSSNGRKYYIKKWWDGTIRHWTVNDGVWKNKR